MNSAEILVIDDELQIQKLLEITLQSNGYSVKQAFTAREGIIAAASHPPDLILLDLGLPDENGQEVLKKLKSWYANSILILSVQNREEDIVHALDNGAADYLVKPFRTGELLARIRTALRKNSSDENQFLICFTELEIDLSARIVKKNGLVIKLTSTEYSLLALFAQHAGKVLTHHFLLKQIWGPSYINESQYLRVFIAQIRKKIEQDINKPVHLITESGVGYRLV